MSGGSATLVQYTSVEWGAAHIDAGDLELLAEFTGLSPDLCLKRLSEYRVEEMAEAWRDSNPKTPKEIRRFYERTDHYLWELLGWNGSDAYTGYLQTLDHLAAMLPPSRHPRVLDYGSGVGSAALRLVELGYNVTVADVPGRTFEFACSRLARRGIDFGTLAIEDDVPTLPAGTWDIIASFDVLEHVPDPAAMTRKLVDAIPDGGGAALAVTFETNDRYPHHLQEGTYRFTGDRWRLFLQGLGMQHRGWGVYVKLHRPSRVARRLVYTLWRATGIHVERIPR